MQQKLMETKPKQHLAELLFSTEHIFVLFFYCCKCELIPNYWFNCCISCTTQI